MLSIFGKSRAKSPSELVKAIKDDLEVLDKKMDAKSSQKASEEMSKQLLAMKNMLYGDGDNPPSPDLIVQLANEAQRNNLLELLVTNLARFEFEARKDVAQIFNNLLRRQASNGQTMVSFVLSKPVILETLVNGYENTEVALNCGSMLRECIRQEVLAKAILDSESDLFYKFFKYVEVSTFDVASDAFATFKDLLSKHKTMVAEFLEKNFDKVIDAYTGLLNSANYVTRRQSLKLLGELLLDRANFNIMTRYISSADNLKLTMNLLRDKSKSIQFEAFHVFKVFVANPHKSAPIRDILYKNKDKLIAFLQNFQNDKEEDEQFSEEKQLLLKEISNLQPPATTAT